MDGQFNFANCLVDGRGVDRDISQAAHYFKLAADNGCHTSQYNYAHMCAIGHGVDVNLAERYSKSVMTLQWSHSWIPWFARSCQVRTAYFV